MLLFAPHLGILLPTTPPNHSPGFTADLCLSVHTGWVYLSNVESITDAAILHEDSSFW